MEFINALIYLSLVLDFKILHASLIIEEEPESVKDSHEINREQHTNDAVKSFTVEEREKLLAMLEKQYKSNGRGSFLGFSKSISGYLDWKAKKMSQSGWTSNPPTSSQGKCRIVGFSCSSGGWNAKTEEISDNDSEKLKNENSKTEGWGSGWNSGQEGWGNLGKCCNNDLCLQGKCCIPTPSRRSNSHCKKNADCCNGGQCHRGKCLIPRRSACTDSHECFKSQCFNNTCCITGCPSDTKNFFNLKSDSDSCTSTADCCGNAFCDTDVTGKCKLNVDQNCSCKDQCRNGLECSSAGKCCVDDYKTGCQSSSQCCYADTGSTCTSNKCTPIEISGCKGFKFYGKDF